MITKEDIKLIQKLKSEERGKKSTQSYNIFRRWGYRKESEKLMVDLASPLKLSYLDVIIYMVGKMAKNMLFIVFNIIPQKILTHVVQSVPVFCNCSNTFNPFKRVITGHRVSVESWGWRRWLLEINSQPGSCRTRSCESKFCLKSRLAIFTMRGVSNCQGCFPVSWH